MVEQLFLDRDNCDFFVKNLVQYHTDYFRLSGICIQAKVKLSLKPNFDF